MHIVIQKLDNYVRYILPMIHSICCAVCIFLIWILYTYNNLFNCSVNDYTIMTIVVVAKKCQHVCACIWRDSIISYKEMTRNKMVYE